MFNGANTGSGGIHPHHLEALLAMHHSPLDQRIFKETCTADLVTDFGKLLYLEQCQMVALAGSKDCAEETVDLKVSIQQSL